MSEDSPIYHQASLVSAEEILSSPDASFWLKTALQSALLRDPVDASNDADVLAAVLAGRYKAGFTSSSLKA